MADREPEVDIEQPAALTEYLRRGGKVGPDEGPRIRVLAGGVSNKTVLVERPSGEAWVLKQALPKLRVKVDWFSDPARIHREAEALRWLPKLAPRGAITPLVFEDREHHLFAMHAVPQPHRNLKTLLLSGEVRPNHMAMFGSLIEMIHRKAFESRGPESIRLTFEDRSFFESLRIEPYYLYTASQVPAAAPFLHALVEETRRELHTLVHGDYSPKNVLVTADDRLVLLDHEVIHWGDPAFDVGFALTHLLSKAHHLPAHRHEFASAVDTFWDAYWPAGSAHWSGDMRARAVRHTLACLLARVAGRSPLEYLTDAQRARQAAAVTGLMARPPGSVKELSTQFLEKV